MNKISIDGANIERALAEVQRVYLCGDLVFPQDSLEHIQSKGMEIGISDYKEFTVDKPHFHTKTTEYNYVLSGATKLFLIDSQEEQIYRLSEKDARYASQSAGVYITGQAQRAYLSLQRMVYPSLPSASSR